MSRVYLEPGVIGARPGDDPVDEAAIGSDAAEALRTLTETGHELVLVTGRPVRLPASFPKMRDMLAPNAERDGWFLTSDPEHCGSRRAGIRSILVGPAPVTRRAAIHRCDIQTRDLRSAVLEILTREAMTPVG
ncbi:MAG TPA: hypothetical protein VGQ58_10000 [Candidatus Limnocylindrales bacterium]|jgi:hypothetical protein|nr:hypothetical protein [Candidatus Limnocylindrales bacterium]